MDWSKIIKIILIIFFFVCFVFDMNRFKTYQNVYYGVHSILDLILLLFIMGL